MVCPFSSHGCRCEECWDGRDEPAPAVFKYDQNRIGSGILIKAPKPHVCEKPNPNACDPGDVFKCDCGKAFTLKEIDTYDPGNPLSGGKYKTWGIC